LSHSSRGWSSFYLSSGKNLSRTCIMFVQGMQHRRLLILHKLAICCVTKEPWPKWHKLALTSSFGQGMLESFLFGIIWLFLPKSSFFWKDGLLCVDSSWCWISMLNIDDIYWIQFNTIPRCSIEWNWICSCLIVHCSIQFMNCAYGICYLIKAPKVSKSLGEKSNKKYFYGSNPSLKAKGTLLAN